MGNHILGGGAISSRIADRLRQKDGLSYGAGSMFRAQPLDERAQLVINAIYNPDNLPKVEAGVSEELERFIEGGVTSDELEKAKAGILEQRRVARSSDGGLAGMLVSQLFTNRTFQEEAEEDRHIEALTPEAVNAAVRKLLDPERLSVITAGDFKEGSEK
jgi:zinc protease